MDTLLGVALILGFLAVMYGPAVFAIVNKHELRWVLLGISILLPFLGGVITIVIMWASLPGEAVASDLPRRQCPSCQLSYSPADYDPSAPRWLCDRCGDPLPKAS